MDDVLVQLLSVTNIVFCIIIAVLVELQNRLVSKFWPGASQNKVYREFLLPLGPICTGGVLAALISSYPYPEMFSSFWARVFFGIVCGLASAHVYRIAKKFIVKKEEISEEVPKETP